MITKRAPQSGAVEAVIPHLTQARFVAAIRLAHIGAELGAFRIWRGTHGAVELHCEWFVIASRTLG